MALPFYDDGASSCFPINSQIAVTAAHCISASCALVAVRGEPATTSVYSKDYINKLAHDRDFVFVHPTRTEFHPNLIDTSVVLRRGDAVYFGGYPAISGKEGFDGVRHAQRSPEFFVGHVIGPVVGDSSPNLIWIEVPWRDYHGCSGGPAAVVDANGNIRVWGVVVRVGLIGDAQPPGGLRFAIGIARLPQSVLDHVRKSQFQRRTERFRATTQPAELDPLDYPSPGCD